MPEGDPSLDLYVPSLLRTWDDRQEQRHAELPGTLMSVDIAGFTALSERLAALGRRGAEEVTALVNGVFTDAIGTAESVGGQVLTFGGDGLIVWLEGRGQTAAAAFAAATMQAQIAAPRLTHSGESIPLRMSVGIHSGTVWFFTVRPGHRDLVVTGPGAATTLRAESAAEAGQVLLSPAAAADLPADLLGEGDTEHIALLLDRALSMPRNPHTSPGGLMAPPELAAVAAHPAHEFVPPGQAALVAAGAGHGEHRMVTSAFIRIADLDARIQAEGSHRVQQHLDHLMDVLAAALAATGVHWIQSDAYPGGAKILLAAGAPTSTGDDETAMLRCLRQIADAGCALDLRMGTARGPTFGGDVGSTRSRRAYAVMGDDVNLAARLMGRAGPAQVIATNDLLQHASAQATATRLAPFAVKGKVVPIEAYAVEAVEQQEVGVEASDSPFIGRHGELEHLRAAAATADGGTGRAILLVAEAGLGKSRLLTEFVSTAPLPLVGRARADRYQANTAYALAVQLLTAIVGEAAISDAEQVIASATPHLGDASVLVPLLGAILGIDIPDTAESAAIDARFVQARAGDVVARWILGAASASGAALLVVEDLHWADDGSRLILNRVVRHASGHPVLLVATSRPGSAELQGAEPLALGPLDTAAAAALAASVGDNLPDRVIDAMVRRADGNPLFVRQLVMAASAQPGAGTMEVEDLPDSLDALITARIDTLHANDRLTLREAGVLGARVDLALLQAVRGCPVPAGWDRRVTEFMEPVEPGTLSFRHDLYRGAAYASLSFERRAELHRDVGLALEQRGATDAVLALHFDRAGDAPRAFGYARAAATTARRGHAVAEAATLLTAAATNASAAMVSPKDHRAVLEDLGDVREVMGEFAVAADSYAGALATVAEDPAAASRLRRKIGLTQQRLGRFERAREEYSAALAQATAVADPRLAAQLQTAARVGLAGLSYREGRFADAQDMALRAIADRTGQVPGPAVDTEGRSLLARALMLVDLSRKAGGGDDDYAGLAAPMFAEAGDLIGEGDALNNEGIAAFYAGRWDDALAAYLRSEDARRRAGDVMGQGMSANNVGEVLSDQGRYAEAEVRFSSALRDWQAADFALGVALAQSNLGRLAVRRGNVAEGRALLEQSRQQFTAIDAAQYVRETDGRLAEADLAAGMPERSLQRLGEVGQAIERGSLPAVEAWLRRLTGEALLACGRSTEGSAVLRAVVDDESAAEVPYEVMCAARALGEVDMADGLALRLGIVSTAERR